MKIFEILNEGNYDYRLVRLKKELMASDKPNIFNSQEVMQKFADMASAQRHLPEEAMLAAQRIIGGGVLSNQLEHIGDMSHRIAERVFVRTGSIESAVEHLSPKVERGLKSLKSGYGFEREMHENFNSNWKHSVMKRGEYNSYDEFVAAIKEACLHYANEHAKLPVYNIVHQHCRDAAIALGHWDFKKTIYHLEQLKRMIDGGTIYRQASMYVEGLK